MDQFGEKLVIDDVFYSHLIVVEKLATVLVAIFFVWMGEVAGHVCINVWVVC